jgi:hypothetical protein
VKVGSRDLKMYIRSIPLAFNTHKKYIRNSAVFEIAGSNPAWGMDVSACFCVVLSCVSVEALRWTDPPTKKSYQISVDRKVH